MAHAAHNQVSAWINAEVELPTVATDPDTGRNASVVVLVRTVRNAVYTARYLPGWIDGDGDVCGNPVWELCGREGLQIEPSEVAEWTGVPA